MGRLIANAKGANTPFFAAVAKGKKIIATSKSDGLNNPLDHAEILAMKIALKKMKAKSLKGCTLYSTCESCPMCAGAIHWVGIKEAVFGATILDSRRFGFDEMMVPALGAALKSRGVKFNKGIMRKECLELFSRNK